MIESKIHTILGSNNIIIIVPDGYEEKNQHGSSNYLAKLGIEMADHLSCYGVINSKYRKTILDLTDVEAIKKRKKITESFLLKIKQFKDEVSENNLLPLILILQQSPISHEVKNHILIGYGQGERGNNSAPHRPTISPSTISKYRLALDDRHFTTEIAPTSSNLCGRDEHHLNQLFRQKNYVEGFYDPAVRSLTLTLSQDITAEEGSAKIAAVALTKAFEQFKQEMALVRKVETNIIDVDTNEDLQYIFRIHNDNRYNELARESYIEELAVSIEKNGLLHPLVLLQKHDGRYKILCGYRRFKAISRIQQKWVEAKIFQEKDFTTEDFFNISLAENTKRRNLNPVEIGNFLETASKTMGLNDALLAERFGETLGIGMPGQSVSHSTVHKYRKVNRMRERGESPEIINDIINENLSFTVVAEILAPIKSDSDRDALYTDIIKTLMPTRPQLLKILSLLKQKNDTLKSAIQSKKTKQLIAKAMESKQRAGTFIKLYQGTQRASSGMAEEQFTEKIATLRTVYFGKAATKKSFDLTPDNKKQGASYNLKINITHDNYHEVLDKVKSLLDKEKLIKPNQN